MTVAYDLTGRRALVTGGGQSVGYAIARSLGRAGAEVIVNDLLLERAERAAAELVAEGHAAHASAFDVSDYDAVRRALDDTQVDILVNNAGNAGPEGFTFTPFVETEPAEWDRYFKVNLFGVMHCTRAVLPRMIDNRWGRIITIVSDAARWGEPRMAAYSAAKAGAAGFTRSVARDVGRYGVTVNNVSLATIDPGVRSAADLSEEDAARREKQFQSYIVRRPGRPDEVAALVTFLASPLSEWITGQTYPMNGGYTVNQ